MSIALLIKMTVLLRVNLIYRIRAFNDCVINGIATPFSTPAILPPPNLNTTFNSTTNRLTGSKGYFTNRVELSWSANNPQSLDLVKIYRKILGTADSILITAVNPSTGLYIDNTADARVFYEYTIRGEKNCNGSMLYSNLSKDVGFRNPMGTLSGNIQFVGGIAVADVRVKAEASSGDAGYSLQFTGGSATATDKPAIEPGAGFRLETWLRPINHIDGSVLTKTGAFSITKTGTDYVVSITTSVSTYSINIPDTLLPVGSWRGISIQYNGANLTVYVSGAQVGSVAATGTIVNTATDFVIAGGANHFYIDEMRMMSVAVDSATAVRDYSRYMNGNEVGFKLYIHNDEGVGNSAYDVSKAGNVYNANHFALSGSYAWSVSRPSSAELSYTAYTNSLGNYVISGIRYNGFGDNYTVIPSIGVHQFSPGSRSLYIGDLSQVFNNQDFEDISSFEVTGTVRYHNPDLPFFPATNCYVPGANVKVDGQPVIKNGVPVVTQPDGSFTTRVPIGVHLLTIDKFQHTMMDSSYFSDFQAPVSGLAFSDTTTRLVVGRVVGGLVEANKAPGMGRSKNNLGVAKIRFNTPIVGIPCVSRTILTDPITGEYKVKLPPMQFKVDTVFAITAVNTINPSTLTNGNSTFNLTNFSNPTKEIDSLFDAMGGLVSIDSIEYTRELNFVHRASPTVNFLDTLGNKFIGEDTLYYAGDTIPIPSTISTWGPFDWPVFKQGNTYHGELSASEIYTNTDNGDKDTVMLSGNALFTNQLINGGDPTPSVPLENGKARYKFVAGDPNNATGSIPAFNYTKTLQISVVPQGAPSVTWKPNLVAYPSNSEYRAILLGSKITGTGVATLGPERVDYILRDPAGSGSSATWTSGSSTTLAVAMSASLSASKTVSAEVKTGFEQSVGIGVSVPVDVEVTQGLGMTVAASATIGGGFSETITSNSSVSTRDDENNVGAEADIFIGRSRNWLVGPTSNVELIDAALCASNGGNVLTCFGTEVAGKRMAKKFGYAIQPSEVKTRFSYTQNEIETVVIPTLEAIRSVKIAGPLFTNVLVSSDPRHGANNDDPIFGISVSTTTPLVYEGADKVGLSYTYIGNSSQSDSVRIINQQIALWKQALAQNEREKWKAINNTGGILIDNFTLGSAIVTNSYEVSTNVEVSTSFELSLSTEQKLGISAEAGGVGASIEQSVSLTQTLGGSISAGLSSTTSFEYTLTDGDPGDIFSIDVYKSSEGTGNIFVTRGGRSMCPYEDVVQPHYFNPTNPGAIITSHTYIANPSSTIQLATIQREMPDIVITPSQQFNIPSNQQAVYQLVLTNQSPEIVDNDIDMKVRVASQSNPNGAIVKIDGLSPNTSYTIPAGAAVIKTLTVERGPIYVEYDSLMIIFSSECSDDIADTAYISVHFIPTCTELALVNPTNNWVLNTNNNDEMIVKMGEYNYNYGAASVIIGGVPTNLGFSRIGFEMKPSTGSAWLQLEQFLKYPTALDSVIPSNNIITQYPWNVSQIPDGNYELRAKSYCLNFDGSYSFKTSPVFAGKMDRIYPHPFGTPTPGDGILDPNDDISIQFNEPIDLGSIGWNNFQVRGVLNGSTLRHTEFVNFDGTNDYLEVPGGAGLQRKDLTIEYWARLLATGQEQVVVAQGIDPGQALTFGMDATNRMKFSLAGQTVISNAAVANPTIWNHYAVAYSHENSEAYLYLNGVLQNSGNINLATSYDGSGKLYFGKQVPQNTNYYQGHLHEARIWNKVRTAGEIVLNFNTSLGSNTSGLVHNWQMDEADGIIVKDKIRERNAVMYGANWQVDPNGFAGTFDGTDDYLEINASTIPITKQMDATVEFWFNSNQAAAATLFSSGKGDGIGGDSLVGWEINKDALGKIHVLHKGLDFIAVDSNYFDGSWHHFALILNRNANLSAYVDGNLKNSVQSIGFGAMSGTYYTAGARGFVTSIGTYNQDSHFQGLLDEVRVWNTARKFEQVKRDMHNRMKGDEYALLAHVPFEAYTVVLNVPQLNAQISNNAPAFPVATVLAQNGATTTNQTPVIKLPRPVENVNFTWSLNNDKIIITPTTSQELLENQTIDITVKDMYDLQANKMQSPKTWIAYFNKNQVYWENDVLSYEISVDDDLQFTGKILNTGGAAKAYNLSGLPSWLTANITSGVIAPNSSQLINFTVQDGLNVGEYYADIAVTTDFNYPELLRLSLKVNGVAPNWVLDPTDFQYSMAVIGEIKLDGIINGNVGTTIAGFMNDTLCALGQLQYVPAYDRYEVFLNLYGNQEVGDSVLFQVYDANTGNLFPVVTPSIYFVEGDVLGSVSSPVTFEAALMLERKIALHSGWTWVSLPLADPNQSSSNDLFVNNMFNNGDLVKGQTFYDQYDPSMNWLGTISQNGGYENVRTYKVKKQVADTLTILGFRIHPDSSYAQINLVNGWNWIGFMSTKNLPLAEALGNYTPQNGDLIKSQYQFATYDLLSNSWYGSLTTMRPGFGYVMKTTAASSFNYPLTAFLRSAIIEQTPIVPFYPLNEGDFAQTMSVTLKSNLCEEQLEAGQIILGAFDVNNQLRGFAQPTWNDAARDYLFYLTVYGNTNDEVLKLTYFDNSSGTKIKSETTISFVNDGILGEVSYPIVANVPSKNTCLELDENSTTENNEISVEPNPFVDGFTVTTPEEFSGKVEIFNLLGALIYSKDVTDTNTIDWRVNEAKVNVASGVYFIRLTDKQGAVQQKRIMKTTNNK